MLKKSKTFCKFYLNIFHVCQIIIASLFLKILTQFLKWRILSQSLIVYHFKTILLFFLFINSLFLKKSTNFYIHFLGGWKLFFFFGKFLQQLIQLNCRHRKSLIKEISSFCFLVVHFPINHWMVEFFFYYQLCYIISGSTTACNAVGFMNKL